MNSTILDEAEQRLAPTVAAAQHNQQDIVNAMRDEIGRQHYAQAQVELPKLEHFIAKESRPFLARLLRLSRQAKTPLPPYVLAWIREMDELPESVTRWVRDGLREWDGLTPPFMPGTQQIDTMRRGAEVGSLRMRLTNWNGMESRLCLLRAYIEQYIKESGWPSGEPGPATTVTEPQREPAAVTVET